MKKQKKAAVAFWCALAASVLAAPLFAWSFIEWEVPFYALSVALITLAGVVMLTAVRLLSGKTFGRALAFGLLAGAAYAVVLEGLTFGINNIWLNGKLPWAAALAVTACVFLFCLVLSFSMLRRLHSGAGKKAVAVLLCLCLLCGGAAFALPPALDAYYRTSGKRVASPACFGESPGRALPEPADDADFYISPSGSDENNGSFASPFATFARAQQAVRETDKTGRTGITVAVTAGEYRVAGLRFTGEDGGTESCPVEWRAYGDGEAVINGGVTLSPADFRPVTDEHALSRLSEAARAHVRVLDLGALGVAPEEYGRIYAIGSYNTASKYDGDYTGPLYAELFVNDTRCSLARYPDEGWLKTGEVVQVGEGKESNGALTLNRNWDEVRNPAGDVYRVDAALAARIAGWETLEDVWMYGFWKYTWADASSPVGAFDAEARTLSPKFVSLYGAEENAPYYFFNVFEELDAPGEWYLDRENGLLYLYAPEDFASAAVDLSLTAQTLVSGEGIDWFTLKGFTLKGTRGNAVQITGDHNTVERCLIKNVAGTALLLYGRENTARENEITRTGMAGILLSGGDPDTLTPGNNRAENNLIHDWSEIYRTYQPAVSLYGAGNVCAHNEIYNSPHEAITYSGPNQLIEYNLIHDVCLLSDDAGAIYAGRNLSSYGCEIRYNAIYDLGTPGEHYPQGIYMDDGLSGQTIYGNLLVNVPGFGIQLGGGRDYTVMNNIVVNTGSHGLSYDQRSIDGTQGGWFTHCDEMWAELNTHPWQSEVWQKAFPMLEGLHYDAARSNEHMYFPNAANSNVHGNLFVNLRGEVGDIQENPLRYSDFEPNFSYRMGALKKLFADPEHGDYTLREGSAFLKKWPGFERLPLSEIGRVN